MNSLQRTLIEKVGNEYGFEYVLKETTESVTLASARHRAEMLVSLKSGQIMKMER